MLIQTLQLTEEIQIIFNLIIYLTFFIYSIQKIEMESHLHKNTFKHAKKRCLSELEEITTPPVFHTPTQPLPIFLQQHHSPSKTIIKVFDNDRQAHLKIFIFQYLELCFGKNKESDPDQYLDKIYQLLEKPEFQFFLPDQPSSLEDQTHISMKNLLSQFLNYLSLGKQSIEQAFDRYPAVLDIFISFLRTLLYLGDVCCSYNEFVNLEQIYDFLNSYFEIDFIQQDQNYYKFINSKVYVYEQNPHKVYMIYGERNEPSNRPSLFSTKNQQNIRKSSLSSVNFMISNLQIGEESQIEDRQLEFFPQRDPIRKEALKKLRKQNSEELTKAKNTYHEKVWFQEQSNVDMEKEQQKSNPCKLSKSIKKLNLVDTTETFYRPISIYEESQLEWKYEFHHKDPKSHSQNSGNIGYSAVKSKFSMTDEWDKKKQTEKMKEELMQEWKVDTKKKKNVWINKNITKQYTSSLILKEVIEPYRSKIQFKKARAREERKAAKFMLL